MYEIYDKERRKQHKSLGRKNTRLLSSAIKFAKLNRAMNGLHVLSLLHEFWLC